jgi:O-antigen/teichoic acid export membrane protein
MIQSGPDTSNRILKAIALLGGASVISVLLGLVKMKVAALLLGPVGVGIIGLLQNAVGVATTIGDMGMRQSGARHISRELGETRKESVALAVQTICWMGVLLASFSGLIFFLLRNIVATQLFAQVGLSDDLGWSTLAVIATILAAPLTAILNGHQRVSDIGRLTIWSGLFSCILSVIGLWVWKYDAISIVIVSPPLLLFACALWYVVKLGVLEPPGTLNSRHVALAGQLLRLGVFVMLGAVALSLSELLVRLEINASLGGSELGLFSATWTIGVYYLNFLMIATSSEFFPRLASNFDDAKNRDQAINQQLLALCFVSAPVFIVLSAFAPLVLSILFSSAFVDASELVRQAVIGDVLRLAIYPLGFVLLAANEGRTYFSMKLVEAICFAVTAKLLMPVHGLTGVGLAHIATFALLFASYCVVLSRRTGFRLNRNSMLAIGLLLLGVISLYSLSLVAELAAMLFGGMLLTLWCATALRYAIKHRQTQTDPTKLSRTG